MMNLVKMLKTRLGETLTRVSGSWLDDDTLAGDELSLSLRRFNHALRNPVLDRSTGRSVFDLSHCKQARSQLAA